MVSGPALLTELVLEWDVGLGRRQLCPRLGTQDIHYLTQDGLLTSENGFQALGGVAVEVEVISDLDRLRRSQANRFGKCLTTIPGDDQHTWMLTEPGGNYLHLACG